MQSKNPRERICFALLMAVFLFAPVMMGALSCTAAGGKQAAGKTKQAVGKIGQVQAQAKNEYVPTTKREQFLYDLADAAFDQTKSEVVYDPAYYKIDYPGGDVPENIGVCADVVVRAYRAAFGIDLQKEVHVDMKAHFSLYPKKWGLKRTDTNIDHRRVPNLMKFFSRKGVELPITNDAADYEPGDIVAYDLNGKGLTHIGIVAREVSNDGQRHMLIHNIGAGPQCEDVLLDWEVIGHYRYYGDKKFNDEKKQK